MTATGNQHRDTGRSGRVARLASEAATAARVRALTSDPDVIAYRVERVRAQVDGLLWAGIVLGLAFTMVNVQTFAATGHEPGSLGWWVAWLLDPMVSLVLLAVLRAEQVTARYQVALPPWGRRTKWLTFAATYVMNTWTSWGLADVSLSWAGVVLHSVPPLVVFATAETGPGLRDRLTEAVRHALTEHTTGTVPDSGPAVTTLPTAPPAPVEPARELAPTAVHEPVRELGPLPVREPAPARSTGARRLAGRGRKPSAPAPRPRLADYLNQARTARATGTPAALTPAWVREVTGCSAGTSLKVAAALRDDDTTAATATADTGAETTESVSVREGEAA